MARRKFLLAEFETPADIVDAAGKMREAGYRRFEALVPFPVHGLDKAMGIGVSKLGWLVFPAGIAGVTTGLVLEWYSAAGAYPLIVGGKPYFSFPAFIPVMFALTILFSAFGAVISMLALNGLPALGHPLLAKAGPQRRATDDRFVISVESSDPRFDAQKTADLLERLGGTHVTLVEA